MRLIRRLESASILMGINPRRGVRNMTSLGRFFAQRREFLNQAARSGVEFPLGRLYPCLGDDEEGAGTASGAYFHQDLLVAQRVFMRSPERHVDIGSRVDGLVSHIAAFRPVEVFDIRPLRTSARNIHFRQCDAMKPDALPESYADSVSCLHALEHFGLGRYGDPIDFNGHLAGWTNLVRTLAPGGVLYLSVPIGPQRIEFNGQRVFSVPYLLSLAEQHGLRVLDFSYVDDSGELHASSSLEAGAIDTNYGCQCGCGIFEFQKPAEHS